MEDREKVIKEYEDYVNSYISLTTSHDYEFEMHKAVLALLKEQEPVRCKQCAYALFKEGAAEPDHIVCTKPFTDHWQSVKPDDWLCADGERRKNDA